MSVVVWLIVTDIRSEPMTMDLSTIKTGKINCDGCCTFHLQHFNCIFNSRLQGAKTTASHSQTHIRNTLIDESKFMPHGAHGETILSARWHLDQLALSLDLSYCSSFDEMRHKFSRPMLHLRFKSLRIKPTWLIDSFSQMKKDIEAWFQPEEWE